MRLHGATSQKTVNFTLVAMRTWNLTLYAFFVCPILVTCPVHCSISDFSVLTTWGDIQAIPSLDFVAYRATLNADHYCTTHQQLKKAICRERPGLLTEKVILLHDNGQPLTTGTEMHLLKQFHWKCLAHPCHNLDIVPGSEVPELL
jgi:hypothetical protein